MTRVAISATASYIKVAGIWYRAEYEAIEAPARLPATGAPDWLWYQEASRWFHLTRKRQCGEKELRANRLVNSPPLD